jgi:hypothetical protein
MSAMDFEWKHVWPPGHTANTHCIHAQTPQELRLRAFLVRLPLYDDAPGTRVPPNELHSFQGGG